MDNSNEPKTGDIKNYVIVGSLVGGSLGFLSSAESGKKLASKISQSEAAREAGLQIRQTLQDAALEQLTNTLRNSVSGYLKSEKQSNSPALDNSVQTELLTENTGKHELISNYEEMKDRTEHIESRLDRMENMLSKLIENVNEK